MRISFLFVAAMLLLLTSCSKNPIAPEVEQMSEETTVQGRKYNPCYPPTVYNLDQLATALNNYENCDGFPTANLPMVCTEPVGEADVSQCKYSPSVTDFPMTGSQVIQIYNQLTSCSVLMTCYDPDYPLSNYNFLFGAHETTTLCGDFVRIDYYELQCCRVQFPD